MLAWLSGLTSDALGFQIPFPTGMLVGTAAFLFPRKLPSHPCCRGPENLFSPKLKGMYGWELSGLAAAKLISFLPKLFLWETVCGGHSWRNP